MSVITFVNSIEEKTGKTLSLAAIATNMAIENNNRILIISTTDKEDRIRTCFFEDKQVKKMKLGLFSENKTRLEEESGIQGIAKISRSNKLTPELITNFTRVVFKDRLEIILGPGENEKIEEQEKIDTEYIDLISVANKYYDYVFVDLDNNLDENIRNRIIEISDLVVVNVSQNYRNIKKLKEFKENENLLKSAKSLILIGRYDKYSKYNSKNISRFLEEKNQVLTIPYNTLYFEAADEAGVPDLLLSLRKLNDVEDRNYIFIQEVKRASENIIYRLQELQMKM